MPLLRRLHRTRGRGGSLVGFEVSVQFQIELGAGTALIAFAVITRHSPVHDQHLAVVPDHQISRFEVAVENAVAMREGDAVAGADEDFDQPPEGISATVAAAVLGEFRENHPQRLSLNPLHREVDADIVEHPHPVNRHDVRVIDLSGRARLADEGFDPFGLVPVLRTKQLECDIAVESGLVSGEHRSHAADADGG